jgi:hypothetical protein
MRPDVLARLLVNLGDSREVARRSLTWLAEYQAARSVSLWRSNGDSASLELGAVLDEATLLGARHALSTGQADLGRGLPVLRDRWALVPTGVPDCFAYLEGVAPDRLDIRTTAAIATFALRILHGEERPLPDPGTWLSPAPTPRAAAGHVPPFPVARKHVGA